MSENKRSIALVHEICPICGKPMNEQILMNKDIIKKIMGLIKFKYVLMEKELI